MIDSWNSKVDFYNANHSFYKSVNLPKGQAMFYGSILLISEAEVNADASIEIWYSYHEDGSDSSAARIINEDGVEYFYSDNGFATEILHFDTSPSKLRVPFTNSDYTENFYKMYSLPSFTFEQTFHFSMKQIKFEVAGEKLYTFDSNLNNVVIYNLDYTIWKTINVPVPATYHLFMIDNISDHEINNDDLIEITYTYQGDLLVDPFHYEGAVANENGDLLLNVPVSSDLELSKIEGLDNKLIATLHGPLQADYNIGGKVFSIDSQLKAEAFSKNDIIVTPNPTSNYININSSKQITSCKLYNTSGILVGDFTELSNNKIDVRNYATGIYLLRIESGSKSETRKIVITH